jgi:hypothetical protein
MITHIQPKPFADCRKIPNSVAQFEVELVSPPEEGNE